MRKMLVLAALAALAGCSSGGGSSSSGSTGTTGGTTTGSSGTTGSGSTTLDISGTVAVHPLVSALGDAGLVDAAVPAFAGQTLYIDEPLIALEDGVESGRLASTTLAADGTFTASQVPVDIVQIGLVGTMASDSPDGGFFACDTDAGAPAFCSGWSRGVSLLWENWQSNKPSGPITGAKLYGVPVALADALSRNIQAVPNQTWLPAGKSLLDVGFVLGYVLDASGQPMSGVTFDTSNNGYDVVYFDDSLVPGASGTNKYGMFVIVAPGVPATHTFGIVGHSELGCHAVGSNPGTVLSLVWDARSPGTCN